MYKKYLFNFICIQKYSSGDPNPLKWENVFQEPESSICKELKNYISIISLWLGGLLENMCG